MTEETQRSTPTEVIIREPMWIDQGVEYDPETRELTNIENHTTVLDEVEQLEDQKRYALRHPDRPDYWFERFSDLEMYLQDDESPLIEYICEQLANRGVDEDECEVIRHQLTRAQRPLAANEYDEVAECLDFQPGEIDSVATLLRDLRAGKWR